MSNSTSDTPRASGTDSVFDNLDAIRLGPDAAATAGSREVLTRVPVQKPPRGTFVRVHPGADMQVVTAVYDDKIDREIFFVTVDMRSELAGSLKPVLLVTAITRQGVVFVWPIALPNENGRRDTWGETARNACELAKTSWVRLEADMSLGAYRIYEAEGKLSEPGWPNKDFSELLKLAFKDRVIDNDRHPIINRLRGLS